MKAERNIKMCAMVSLDEFCDDFLNWFDADLSVKYQNGISQNVVLFIKQRYPSALDSIENPTFNIFNIHLIYF